MNVSARLILLLTITVSAVMSAATWFTLRQRSTTLESAVGKEVEAHAQTLQIALEEDFATGRTLDAQRLVDRMREVTGLYGVFLFDAEGRMTIASNERAPEEIRLASQAREVVATGRQIDIARELDGMVVFSVILPLRKDGRRIGALEVAAPISFVRAYVSSRRSDIILTAALLGLTILLVVLPVTHYGLTQPVRSLLEGALALGRGDFGHRVPLPGGGGEFAALAREFNRMADSLNEQRLRAAHEAEERVALERRLRHTENLAMVGRLAAGIAHEMGAPLQVIDGRAKQLQTHADLPRETRQRNLTIIRTQAERITRIVRQLLTLSRPYDLKLQAINLPRVVAGVIELVEMNAERAAIAIQLPLASDEPNDLLAEADPDLVHQVLLNICQNAVQAMSLPGTGKGGLLQIAYDAMEKDGREFVAVRVADTGGGVAPEHMPQIFDPFFTTKEIGQGTGLGLAVSNRIIADHGGWIEAANNHLGGATFSIHLPRAVSPPAEQAEPAGRDDFSRAVTTGHS
jgi:two-component system, NtrC family, sensor kinase